TAEGRAMVARSRRVPPAIARQVAREERVMRETTRDVARRHIAEIVRYCLGPENVQYSSKTELRFGSKGSISVEIGEGDNQGAWWDHEHQRGGGPFELMYEHGGCSRGDERKWLIHNIGLELPPTSENGLSVSTDMSTRPERCYLKWCGSAIQRTSGSAATPNNVAGASRGAAWSPTAHRNSWPHSLKPGSTSSRARKMPI